MNSFLRFQILFGFAALISAAPSDSTFGAPPAIEFTPTVFPAEPFYLDANVETLHKALNLKFGADEKAIVEIVMLHDNEQRLEIAEKYQKVYKQSLIAQLKKKLRGTVKTLILGLMTPLEEFYLQELHDSINTRYIDKDGEVISDFNTTHELFWFLSNEGRRYFDKLYKIRLHVDLKEDMKNNNVPFRFLDVLVKGIPANLESKILSKYYAERLHNALNEQRSRPLNYRTVIRIIVLRSEIDLRNTEEEYNRTYSKRLHQAVSDALCNKEDITCSRAFQLLLG